MTKTLITVDGNDMRQPHSVDRRLQAVDTSHPMPSIAPVNRTDTTNMQPPSAPAQDRDDGWREAAGSDDSPPEYQETYPPSSAAEMESHFDPTTPLIYNDIPMNSTNCALMPNQTAIWKVKGTEIKLGPLASAVLVHEKLLTTEDLEL